MATSMAVSTLLSDSLITHAFEGAWNNTQNTRPAFMALKQRGHIDYGISGADLTWNVKVARHAIAAYGDNDEISIARQNLKMKCVLPWAFYQMSDAITTDEMALMSGEQAFYKRQKELLKDMTDNFESRLSSEFLNSDGGTGSTNILHGNETFFAATASSLTKLATASDTYATQATVLSGLSVPGAESDAWTPTVVNVGKSTTTAGATWVNAGGFVISNALEIFDFGLTQAMRGGTGKENTPDLSIMCRTHWAIMRAAMTANQTGFVDGMPSGAQGFGIPGAMNMSGVEIVMDADCVNTAQSEVSYLLNFNHIYLEILPVPDMSGTPSMSGISGGAKKRMFEVATDNNIAQNALRVRVNWRGQLRYNPRYQVKFIAGA